MCWMCYWASWTDDESDTVLLDTLRLTSCFFWSKTQEASLCFLSEKCLLCEMLLSLLTYQHFSKYKLFLGNLKDFFVLTFQINIYNKICTENKGGVGGGLSRLLHSSVLFQHRTNLTHDCFKLFILFLPCEICEAWVKTVVWLWLEKNLKYKKNHYLFIRFVLLWVYFNKYWKI